VRLGGAVGWSWGGTGPAGTVGTVRMDRVLERQIHEVEEWHWWYRGRRRIIAALVRGLGLAPGVQILDAGCGSGRNMLELSRLEQSSEPVAGEPIDVPALLAMLRKDVLARPVHPREVRVRLDSDALLLGVESEIHSAFSNLVDNAAKYTPADGAIEMRWWVDEDGGHFSVTDTGIGIPSEHIPRLTERFYRVDQGRSRATGGSGLGLAIVKHVLQRHGAELEVRSTIGKGSTFSCHFPPQRVHLARAATAV